MINPLSSQKGFTIVELMVAVLIAGIITAVITSYLLAHIKSYKTAEDVVDIQYEGQLALNQISKIAMESSGVTHIITLDALGVEIDHMTSDVTVVLDDNGEYIAFRELAQNGINETYHIYTIRDNGVINYSQSDYGNLSNPTPESLFTRNVVGLSVTPGKNNLDSLLMSTSESFINANSIDLALSFNKDDAILEVKTQAKFRNK